MKDYILDETLDLISPVNEQEAREELSRIEKIEEEIKKENQENYYKL